MQRRQFLELSAATTTAAAMITATGVLGGCATQRRQQAGPATRSGGTDVFVYGSTPGGIAAAIEAARRGCRVTLACPKMHPGGMAASGLSTTDAVRRDVFGGLVAEFIAGVRKEYAGIFAPDSEDMKLTQDGWFYEPSVAEAVFQRMIDAEERITYLRGHHLLSAAMKRDGDIESVTLDAPDGKHITLMARSFIDGTYEGDLAAAAKADYRVGREGRDEYGESMAGIHYMNFRTGQQIMTPDTGEPSLAIQAFCYRLILTTDPQHRIPLSKPASYEQHLPDYLPILGDFASKRTSTAGPGTKLPRQKYQMNGSIEAMTSLNCPGVGWSYPEAARHHRARLDAFHMDHALGWVWFLQNDERVPAAVRSRWRNIGLHDAEFVKNNHVPWQLYVRQGRRIIGREIVTQNHFIIDKKTGRTPRVEHAIAIGEHSFDVHPCHDRRMAVEGWMEGVLWYPKKAFGPAQPGQVPYGAMLPRGINNLLVPVALSSTHVAMSVLRMEPVWMTTGQVAGLAAAVAMEKRQSVANIDPQPLPAMLKIKVDPYA